MNSTDEPYLYEIIVESELGPDDARLFPGLQITACGGQTMISGPVADQDELGKILDAIASCDLTLVSIKRSDWPDDE